MKHILIPLRAALMAVLICLPLPLPVPTAPAEAQVLGAAERAAARAAARKAAERSAARTSALRAGPQAADRVMRRWTVSQCGAAQRCPLPERHAGTFTGGSYNEVRLGGDTRLYRVYSAPQHRLGVSGERYSYWSRSDARSTQAIVDGAIPTSRNGNMATHQVSVLVPRGTTIYEGTARGLPRAAAGGGNQVVLDNVRPEWIIKR